jgi:signal transduction histidine kinase
LSDLTPQASGPRSEGDPRPEPPAPSALRDLQTLLAGAVQRLRSATTCEAAVAWALRDDATPYVAAAAFVGPPPLAPDREAFEATRLLDGPTDLGDPDLPAPLGDLAERYGYRAAAPVTGGGEHPMAVLLLSGSSEALGGSARASVRPRALAVLEASARRLEGPLAAALSAGRLSRLDQDVRRLDRLAALGELSAEIAHEVRNPLLSVKTFLQLLPEREGDPEFRTRFFEVVTDEIRRMERLLDTVIEHAQPSVDPPGAAAAPNLVLEATVELLRHRAQSRGVEIEATLAPDPQPALPEVALTPDRLRQVVLNLALNAIDATPEGGSVQLRAQHSKIGVELVVSDRGPGIPEALRARVFEPFFSSRSDRPGGLGLAISRRIAEEAGGSLEVRDAPGGGAAFHLNLPAVD